MRGLLGLTVLCLPTRRLGLAVALALLVATGWGAVRWQGARAAVQAAAALRGKRVAIDPGHGGVDAGASGSGVRESVVVLSVALRLRALLEAAGAQVLLTREPDTDFSQFESRFGLRGKIPVQARMQEINAWQPAVLVNVHANSFKAAPTAHGAQVFYAKTGLAGSAHLAQLMQAEIAARTGETRRRANTGVRHYMLDHAEMPAVTVEIGFLSNRREARLLADPAYQEKLARAMYLALARWFAGE